MTVNVDTELGAGHFVPYRGPSNIVNPTGSIEIAMTGTGDGSGGFFNLNLLANRIEFGFHPILVLTLVEANDNLAAIAERFLQYSAQGNERLSQAISIPKVALPTGADFTSIWSGSELAVPVEPNGEGTRGLFTVHWDVNTNLEVYFARIFGLLFDAEALAREVGVDMPDIFYGVR